MSQNNEYQNREGKILGKVDTMVDAPSDSDDDRITVALRDFHAFLAAGEFDIERIPAVAHPINRGLDGLCVYLRGKSGGRDMFLKIVNADTLSEIQFVDALCMAEYAGTRNIAPNVIARNDKKNALLFECLSKDWTFGTAKDFRNQGVRTKALEALKIVHGMERLTSTTSVFDRCGQLEKKINALASDGGEGDIYPDQFQTMRDYIRLIERSLKVAGSALTPCKVENSLSNFMIDAGGDVRLVDFDRATNADPLSDIGMVCNEYCRTEYDIAEAVEIYAGTVSPPTLARVKLYMIASAFYLGLWGVVSHYDSPATGIEFYKYGRNQFMRCLSAISRWDIGQLLREI